MTQTKKPAQWKKAIKGLLLPCILLSFTVGAFLPLETYVSAAGDLWFPITELLPVVVVVTLVLLALSLLIGLILRDVLRDVYCALMVGGSLALYVQGMFLNADYGVLDGTLIDWGSFGSYPIWNTAVWALLLLAPVVLVVLFRTRTVAGIRFVATMLVLTQVFGIGMQLATADLPSGNETYSLSTKDEFHYSKNKNIVVFVFDRLSPTLVSQILEHNPEAFADWDGFVHFTNSTGKFTQTKDALANLLTGEAYNPTEKYQDYLKRAYADAPYWAVLNENDYKVDMYTKQGVSNACVELFDNYVLHKLEVSSGFALFKKMYRMSLFRYAPHVLKPMFWMDGADFNNIIKKTYDGMYEKDDSAFRVRLNEQGITADIDQNMFHFYLFAGAHPPFTLVTPTQDLPAENDQVSQYSQSLNMLDTLSHVLTGMKEQGVYDDSLIVLMGDHGDLSVDPSPALVIKQPGATGAITTNDALVSQDDFWATIYATMGIDATDDQGMNVFEVGDLKRTFDFYFLPFSVNVRHDYELSMLSDGSMHYEQQDTWYDPNGAYAVTPKQVRLNTTYTVVDPNQFCEYCNAYNISRIKNNPSGAGVWLCSPEITLCMKLEGNNIPQSVNLELDLADVMGDSQRVVVARGETVYETITVTPQTQTLVIGVPEACYQNGEVLVELRLPDGASVFEQNGMQNATDPYYRQAIAITGLRVTDASAE